MSMLFISHSSADKEAAEDLYHRLTERGYELPFLDSEPKAGIQAGSDWEQVIYERLKACRGMLVLCSRNWSDSKWCFAELIYAKAMGKEIFPILLEPCTLGPELGEHQGILLHGDGEKAWARLWRALEDRSLGPQDDFGWDSRRCPYPGFPAFSDEYAGVYFGRDRETQEILEKLNTMRAHGQPRFFMIHGGSGSGKSSLLRAGVLPRIKRKARDQWLVLPTLRYADSPNPEVTLLTGLAREITTRFPAEASDRPDWKELRDRFLAEDIRQAARSFLDATLSLTFALGCPHAATLMVIDQFEEFLAPSTGPRAGRLLHFLRVLFQDESSAQLLAIGTLRSDQLDAYERHAYALTAPAFESWRLEPLPRERIADVIRKPAERCHVKIPAELVERLQIDAPTSDALPLLAFTLERLYREAAGDDVIKLDEYNAMGGMEGIVRQTVNNILSKETLTPDRKQALRVSFVRHLAYVNEEDQVIRRRAPWKDLPEAARSLLDKFVEERLLTSDESAGRSVEVAHEALFRCWDDLRQWLKESIAVLQWRRDVQRDRSSAQLRDEKWRGLSRTQFELARRWPRERGKELYDEERQWIRQAGRRRLLAWMTVIGVLAVVSVLVIFSAYQAVAVKVAHRHRDELLEKQVEMYEWIPKAVAPFAVPRLPDGYPLDDPERTRRYVGQLQAKIKRFPASAQLLSDADNLIDLVNTLQDSRSQKKTMRRKETVPNESGWTDATKSAQVLALAAEAEWREDRKLFGFLDKGSDDSLRDAFLRKRRRAYEQTRRVIEWLRAAKRLDGDTKAKYLEFYQLYWGGLLIVEEPDVEGAMVGLGKPSEPGAPLVRWAQDPNAKPPSFDPLADKFLDLLKTKLK